MGTATATIEIGTVQNGTVENGPVGISTVEISTVGISTVENDTATIDPVRIDPVRIDTVRIDTVRIGSLAEAIATDGIAAHEQRVAGVLAGARGAAVSPVLISVLADPREPAAARERAFGRIAMELAKPQTRSSAVRHIATRLQVTDAIRQRSTARVLTAA